MSQNGRTLHLHLDVEVQVVLDTVIILEGLVVVSWFVNF